MKDTVGVIGFWIRVSFSRIFNGEYILSWPSPADHLVQSWQSWHYVTTQTPQDLFCCFSPIGCWDSSDTSFGFVLLRMPMMFGRLFSSSYIECLQDEQEEEKKKCCSAIKTGSYTENQLCCFRSSETDLKLPAPSWWGQIHCLIWAGGESDDIYTVRAVSC